MLKYKPGQKKVARGAFEKWRIRGRAGRNPSFEEKGRLAPSFAKNPKIFPKIYFFQKFNLIFTHFSCEIGTFDLQRPQPHPSARADSSRGYKNRRIPPRQSSAKKRMARQQSDELEKTKRELLGTAQPLRRRRQASVSPRRDSGPKVR